MTFAFSFTAKIVLEYWVLGVVLNADELPKLLKVCAVTVWKMLDVLYKEEGDLAE